MVPVHIVTGFLGGGKTTFLAHLLEESRLVGRAGLVIADMCEENFDGDIIALEHPQRADLLIRLASCGGSASLEAGMAAHVAALLERGAERIVIETSGTAYASSIFAELTGCPALAGRIEMGATFAVVDAFGYDSTVSGFAEHFQTQVAIADVVLLNKRDRVSAAELERIQIEIEHRVPHARVVPTYQGQLPWEHLCPAISGTLVPAMLRRGARAPIVDELDSVVYRNKRRARSQVHFGHNLLNLPFPIVRIKGVLALLSDTLRLSGVPHQLDWYDHPRKRDKTAIAIIGRFDPPALVAAIDEIYDLEAERRWDRGSGAGAPHG